MSLSVTLPKGMRVLSVLILIVWTVGCSGSSLTRTKAKTLIESSTQFRNSSRPLFSASEKDIQIGIEKGFWVLAPRMTAGPLALTPKGEQYFMSVTRALVGVGYTVSLRNSYVPEIVEVTGITGSDPSSQTKTAVKVVEFVWQWKRLPDEVKQCFADVFSKYKGQATLRLYDDGWRVAYIHLYSS